VGQLFQSILTPASTRSYQRAWILLRDLCATNSIPYTMPVSIQTLVLFIAHLVSLNYSPSSITTYVSAIGYVHKLQNLPDPSNTFLVSKLLHSCRKNKVLDSRLPITKSILHQLVSNLSNITSALYNIKLFKSMFLLAFHAFLRVGEITTDSRSHVNVLHVDQVTSHSSDDSIVIEFRHFKHSNGRTFRLSIPSQPVTVFCPVASLHDYLSVRGESPGPLFLCSSNLPVSRHQFNTVLFQSLSYNGFDTSRYKSHSFRIGSATKASSRGYSDSQIRRMGRWKSDAFKTYLRSSHQQSAI
jgi:hypothetical protein